MIRNVLFFTVDDMNQDVLGAFGGRFGPATPHLDAFSREARGFQHAHVAVAVCLPSRSAYMTGRYPTNNGSEGFTAIHPHIPTIPEILKRERGYYTGILGKVTHYCPPSKFQWDHQCDYADLNFGRDPGRYAEEVETMLDEAEAAGLPFFFCVNSHDPHRPFHGSDQEKQKLAPDELARIPAPSRMIGFDEVEVPDFLPDLPEVRREVAEYASSCRRADDTFGAVLRCLEKRGLIDETVIVFTNDHGMPFPFAKTNCYLHSTRAPLLIRWPGVTTPGIDTEHMVSAVDLLPTLFEGLGIGAPVCEREVLLPPTEIARQAWRPARREIDGRSYFPLLGGGAQPDREHVVTVFHESHAWNRYEMRCVQTRDWGYIYNPWSDGWKEFRNESRNGRSFKAMCKAGESDPEIAARVKLFLRRVPEELYCFADDPGALVNRIDDSEAANVLTDLRSRLLAWMDQSKDPVADMFRNRIS